MPFKQGSADFWRHCSLKGALLGASPWLSTSPLYCLLCAFCTRQPDGTFAPELYIFEVCRAAWTHRLNSMCIVPNVPLPCPLWKAYVHNTCHVHLKPGHLMETLGSLPWAWLMTISISSSFVFPFSLNPWTLNPAYDSIGFETYARHQQVKLY